LFNLGFYFNSVFYYIGFSLIRNIWFYAYNEIVQENTSKAGGTIIDILQGNFMKHKPLISEE